MITIDFQRLNIFPGSKILDIGCGEGRHIAKAWEQPGNTCIGADRSHQDLIACRDKLILHEAFSSSASYPSTWALSAADITTLPFPDHIFDIVICSEVLEHIPNEEAAISEIIRILKPGGTLVISVPRYWCEKICWRLSHAYCHTRGGHIRIYKKNQLIKVITRRKLFFLNHHYAHSLHTPFWWIKCLTGLNKKNTLVSLYHRFLIWDIMKKPFITRFMDRLLNPIMGKSVVLYFEKRKIH